MLVEGRAINISRNQLLADIKRILKRYNLRAFKKYSQNFVIDPKLIAWHIQYSDLNEGDRVVEIGAGLGTLTKYLAEKAEKVYAIEFDSKLIQVLQEELASYNNIEIILGDILKLNSEIFEGTKIISNPPYKISSPLTFKIIQSAYVLSVLTYQKEFAERMVALPGTKKYGRITVGVQYYAKVEYLKPIPKSFFYPMPKVDSALIRLTPIKPPFELDDENDFFDFVRHLFSFRNKSVKRAVSLYLKHHEFTGIPEEKIKQMELTNQRIFRLSLQQFYELYQIIRGLKGI